MNATLSPEAVGILGRLADETKRDQRDADTAGATAARKTLKALTAKPNKLADLQKVIDETAVSIAKAELALALGRTKHGNAQSAYNIEAFNVGRELQRLRSACFGPIERDAVARLTQEIESYQQSKDFYAASAALPTLYEARLLLNAMRDGCSDPLDDVDGLVVAAIQTAARLRKEAAKELAVKLREAEKEARRRKIHTY